MAEGKRPNPTLRTGPGADPLRRRGFFHICVVSLGTNLPERDQLFAPGMPPHYQPGRTSLCQEVAAAPMPLGAVLRDSARKRQVTAHHQGRNKQPGIPPRTSWSWFPRNSDEVM